MTARICLLMTLLALLAVPAGAVPPGAPQSAAALKQCDAVDDLPEAQRDDAIERAIASVEAVLAADERDALGHFALFCLLGKRTERAGIGFGALFALRRVKREIDAALRLAPNDADVLAGKGALLLGLPTLLGGDAVEGERLLRRALEVEPSNTDARCHLAAAERARGVAVSVEVPPHC
jgi:cytochrome c-type biogenesis protein CcmH/NrfG